MEAQISLSGYVGTEVEVNEGDGYTYARFRLGCTPRVRKGEIWEDGNTTWISVSASRWLARHVAQCVKKGDPVLVVGRLRTRVWTDREGVPHETLQVEANSVGHDLCRGTTVFTRAVRPEEREVPPSVVDPDTGEVVDFPEYREPEEGEEAIAA